jgi:hypothetical protein
MGPCRHSAGDGSTFAIIKVVARRLVGLVRLATEVIGGGAVGPPARPQRLPHVAPPDLRCAAFLFIRFLVRCGQGHWFGELERAAPFTAHFVVFDGRRNELKLPGRAIAEGLEPVAHGVFTHSDRHLWLMSANWKQPQIDIWEK